jgi:hypothetical protein
MGCQKASGYNKRDRVEAAIGRYKRVIGDGPHSCTDLSRATEIGIAVRALNRMVELGRPHYVRTTWPHTGSRASPPSLPDLCNAVAATPAERGAHLFT